MVSSLMIKDDTIEVAAFLERLRQVDDENKQIKNILEKLEKRVTSLELWDELYQQAKDSIAKVVDTIATAYPEYDEFAHNPEQYIPFMKDVVEHGLLLLFCKRSLEAIFWLFVNNGENVDDQYELTEDDTQRAHMHITHSLKQLCPDNPKCQKIFLTYFNDKTFSNCFAKTTPEFDENKKFASATVNLHQNVIDYWKKNPIEGRAFAIWNIAHEFVHVLSALQFGSTQSPNIEKFVAHLPKSERLESGFVWETFVIGAYPFPVCEKPLQISRILIDFYATNTYSLRKKKKWTDENKLLMSLRGIKIDQSSRIETDTPIAKAKTGWYEEFGLGIDADVFLESSTVPFIEEVLPHDRANESLIQNMRFRSSYIRNSHIRF